MKKLGSCTITLLRLAKAKWENASAKDIKFQAEIGWCKDLKVAQSEDFLSISEDITMQQCFGLFYKIKESDSEEVCCFRADF